MNSASSQIKSEPLLPAGSYLGAVHIAVTDETKALAIWRDVVGLAVINRIDNEIHLGVATNVLIVLHTGASGPVIQKALGLYHVAIHVPERRDMAHFLIRAIEAGIRVGPTDHLISEAIYIWDYDGNGIEITFETPWRGTHGEPATGVFAITTDGKPHSGREALDVDILLSETENDADPRAPMPAGTRIGHVHVHVSDLNASMDFYRDTIGFGGISIIDSFGMGEAGLGYMPHAIAFNIWAGAAATQPPATIAGLRYFTLILPDFDAMRALVGRIEGKSLAVTKLDSGIEVFDPSGNRLRIEIAS